MTEETTSKSITKKDKGPSQSQENPALLLKDDIVASRIKNWRANEAKEQVPFEYKQTFNQEKKQMFLHSKTDEQLSSREAYELIESTLSAAFGAAGRTYLHTLFNQTINAQFGNKEKDGVELATRTVEALLAMDPKDIIEGQLCSRLLILTNHYNEYMHRAAIDGQYLKAIDTYMKQATKLMRLHNETLEALIRYRRKGEQRVTVQHIKVSDGGQAVVGGEVNTRGGGNKKNEGAAHAN